MQLNKAFSEKLARQQTDELGDKTLNSPKAEDSPLKLRTLAWDKPSEAGRRSSIFRIQPQSVADKAKAASSEFSLQSKATGQLKKKASAPSLRFEKIKVGGTEIVPGSLQIEERYKYQLELAARQREIMLEFEKRFRGKLQSLRGQEKKSSRQFLVLFKKACMVFGRFQAEQFVRSEANVSMAIYCKRFDAERAFWSFH